MANVIDYALLSQDVYRNQPAGPESELWNHGWQPVPLEGTPSASSDANNFYGRVYLNRKTREMVVAYRGTVPTPSHSQDIVADWDIVVKEIPSEYYPQAIRLFSAAMNYARANNIPSNKVSITGHSLGGMLAKIVAAHNPDIIAVVFNAPGIGEVQGIDPNKAYPNIYNIDSTYGVINKINKQVGSDSTVDSGSVLCHSRILFAKNQRLTTSKLTKETEASASISLGLTSLLAMCAYNQHSMDNMVKALEKKPIALSGLTQNRKIIPLQDDVQFVQNDQTQ